MPKTDTLANFKTIALEATHWYVSHAVKTAALWNTPLNDPKIDMHVVQHMADRMVFTLADTIYGQRFGPFELRMPATWWEHLKLAHAPGWFTRRWPVRYTTKCIETATLWPGVIPPPPQKIAHVVLREWDETNAKS